MNFAQEKQGASRFTGIGIVALIHVLAIWALASGHEVAPQHERYRSQRAGQKPSRPAS